MERTPQVISIYTTGSHIALRSEGIYFDPAGLARSHATYPHNDEGAVMLLERLADVLGVRVSVLPSAAAEVA